MHERKEEIHALQYAVYRVVAHLELLFDRVLEMPSLNKGLNLHYEFDAISVIVDVFPVGWPKGTYIFMRMVKGMDEKWRVSEGRIKGQFNWFSYGPDEFPFESSEDGIRIVSKTIGNVLGRSDIIESAYLSTTEKLLPDRQDVINAAYRRS